MDQVTQIQIDNFKECMRLAQKSIFAGLTIAALVHYLSTYYQQGELPVVPFVGLKFVTIDSFQMAILVLYVGAGLIGCFSTNRALSVLKSIKNVELSSALARYPSIVAASLGYRAALAGALIGSGLLLVMGVFNYGMFGTYGLFMVVSGPFILTLQIGGRIYEHKDALIDRSNAAPRDGAH